MQGWIAPWLSVLHRSISSIAALGLDKARMLQGLATWCYFIALRSNTGNPFICGNISITRRHTWTGSKHKVGWHKNVSCFSNIFAPDIERTFILQKRLDDGWCALLCNSSDNEHKYCGEACRDGHRDNPGKENISAIKKTTVNFRNVIKYL